MDGRHTHIFGLVAHALDKTEEQITEIAIADERWNLLDEFFKVGGSRKLMWYYQEPKIGETGSANKSDSQVKNTKFSQILARNSVRRSKINGAKAVPDHRA